MADGAPQGRSFARVEPLLHRLGRATLAGLSVFLLGPVAGYATFRVLEGSGTHAGDALRWAIGTGVGVALGGCALYTLWERSSRRRYGDALLLADGATFGGRFDEAQHFSHAELELVEVTEQGVLLARREAGAVERWWRPLLVPTADWASSEALVAEVSEWTRRGEVEPPLRLRPPASQQLVCGLAGAAPFLAYLAVRRLGEGEWRWGALIVWFVLNLDLLRWLFVLSRGVQLLPGSIAMGDERHDLSRVRLELDEEGWLVAWDLEGKEIVDFASLGRAGNRRLQARLGDRLRLAPGTGMNHARRRLLLRALLLYALGTALLAAVIRWTS